MTRASALLGLPVVDPVQGSWGVVVDVLLDVPEPGRTVLRWEVAGLVVSSPGASSWWHFAGLTTPRQRRPPVVVRAGLVGGPVGRGQAGRRTGPGPARRGGRGTGGAPMTVAESLLLGWALFAALVGLLLWLVVRGR